jgi:uncharacterized protein (DUF2141 family)
MLRRLTRHAPIVCAIAANLLFAAPTAADTIVVKVTGIEGDTGEVGCGLSAGAAGFPEEPSAAIAVQRYPADPAGVTCTFTGLTPGAYAVASSQDFNRNKVTDTNLLGIPKEPWGVSNNVRPTLRAPRFDEARIDLSQGQTLEIEIRVAK